MGVLPHSTLSLNFTENSPDPIYRIEFNRTIYAVLVRYLGGYMRRFFSFFAKMDLNIKSVGDFVGKCFKIEVLYL